MQTKDPVRQATFSIHIGRDGGSVTPSDGCGRVALKLTYTYTFLREKIHARTYPEKEERMKEKKEETNDKCRKNP